MPDSPVVPGTDSQFVVVEVLVLEFFFRFFVIPLFVQLVQVLIEVWIIEVVVSRIKQVGHHTRGGCEETVVGIPTKSTDAIDGIAHTQI